MKLNINPREGVNKESQEYDPCYKYSYIFDVLAHNVNAITKYANLDLCGDESTWGYGGFGEKGSGMISRVIKPWSHKRWPGGCVNGYQ